MTPDELRLLYQAFERASACRPEDRAAVLDATCGGDAVLRARVESLLAAEGRTGARPGPPTSAGDVAAAPREAGATSLVGLTVDGRYELRELLGQGGMGAVYRAVQRSLGREVAVKVVRADALTQPGTRERFEREAVVVARLRHPNIVTIYDFGVAPGVGAFIVMEMLRGRTLGAELRRAGPLSAPRAVAVLREICSAVQAAHAAGILHRDLKPENVWLEDAPGGGWTAKVLDFGIAKLADAGDDGANALTHSGVLLGTPAYMPPEQCEGAAFDARSDVYALGCVAYQMLTGEPPFRAQNVWAMLHKHMYQEPRPPGELVPGVPHDVEAAVLRALAKPPGERFASAADFAAALGGHEPAGDGPRPSLPLAGRAPARTSAGNLPHGPRRLIGRGPLVREVVGRLAAARLVTLTGPGGIGKTSLALAVAGQAVADFDGGAWVVELAAIDDPARVAGAVARALGVREQPGRPAEETLVDWLGAKRVLLVLDNCEHLVGPCTELAAAVLRACPGVSVLATSREPLGADGEVLVPVPPLSLPEEGAEVTVEALGAYGATALFLDRAALSRPGFSATERDAPAVASLCRRLDGIPLAIELAAARAKALSAAQILERIDDRFRLLTTGSRTAPRRQQTLRAAVDWSYALLADDERALFRRLSVFAGSWGLDAAEAVTRGGLGGPGSESSASQLDVLDLLEHLVDKSFVVVEHRAEEARYRMLETLRIYAAERLAETDEGPELLGRHAEWFVRFAERAARGLSGPEHAAWLERLDAEHENLRAVLRRATEGVHPGETALRVCVAVGRFWTRRGHVSEGLEWTERALAAAPGAPPVTRARAVATRGLLRYFSGDLDGAAADVVEAAAAQRALGDRAGLPQTLYVYATVLDARSELDAAVEAAEQCRDAAREAGDRHMEAMAKSSVGRVALRRGELERAAGLFAESLAICREIGSTRDAGVMLFNLGQVAVDRGEFERAAAYLAESTEIAQSLGDKIMLAGSRSLSGVVALKRGDLARAERLLGESLSLFHRMNNRLNVAFLMEELVLAAVEGGDPRRALFLAGAAARLREELGASLTDEELASHEAWVARAREALDPAEADRAIEAGRTATLRQAVESAVSARGNLHTTVVFPKTERDAG